MANVFNLLGRVLIAFLFIAGAIQKVVDPTPVREMIVSTGLPGWMIWPVAAFNLSAGIGLITGPRVRSWALILAAYCIATSYFHWELRDDPWQASIFVKNWAIAGGLLILGAAGPGRFAMSGGRSKRVR